MPSERAVAFAPVVDGPGQGMRQHGHGLARAGRCCGTRDQATVGDALRPPGPTPDGMDGIPPHEPQALADPRPCTPPVEGVGVVLVGGMDHGPCQGGAPVVIVIAPREVDRHALLHGRIGQARGHALPVGLVGEVVAELGEGVLAGGLWDMSSPLGTRAHQGHPPAEQVPGGPHRVRVGGGLWEHATSEEPRHVVRVHAVVCGLAPVHGRHGERMPQPSGHTLSRAAVGQPGPRGRRLRRRSPDQHETAP
jgi:hypothetical protein